MISCVQDLQSTYAEKKGAVERHEKGLQELHNFPKSVSSEINPS